MGLSPHLLPSELCSNVTIFMKLSVATWFKTTYFFHLETTAPHPILSLFFFFYCSTSINHLLPYWIITHLLVIFTLPPASVMLALGRRDLLRLFHSLQAPSTEYKLHPCWLSPPKAKKFREGANAPSPISPSCSLRYVWISSSYTFPFCSSWGIIRLPW